MMLLVGLGNPGNQYAQTRHNIGFMVIDAFARKRRAILSQHRFGSYSGKTTIAGAEVVMIKPQTFMNRSGEAVLKAVTALKLDPQQIFVVCDDIDLPFGRIRIRLKGGSAGHNGIKSIAERLRTEDFPRLRVGIGRPPEDVDPADYVLEKFSSLEEEKLEHLIDIASEALHVVFHRGTREAMNIYNRKKLVDQTDEE